MITAEDLQRLYDKHKDKLKADEKANLLKAIKRLKEQQNEQSNVSQIS